ncbi:MAG: hypothetical protein IH945_03520 [Armatimonadetes bacterium]|nr:hypothetical protein [Armatimonadota bacterium]
MYKTRVHRIWTGMKQRCLNPDFAAFSNYGGRGIKVCERWMRFENFFEDMGAPPTGDHSIERIDNDGDYEPGNCRWATRADQLRNTSRNRWLELHGKRRVITDWAAITGLSEHTIRSRLGLGWSVERTLTTPARRKGRSA